MKIITEALCIALAFAVLAAAGLGIAYKHSVSRNAQLTAQVDTLKRVAQEAIEAKGRADAAVVSRDQREKAGREALDRATSASPDWRDAQVPDDVANVLRGRK